MILTIVALVTAAAVLGMIWWRRESGRRTVEAHTIDADELHRLLESGDAPRVFDVRQPLELLAYSEIIPGAERVVPKDLLADPSLIPKDERTVVYCTCPGDKTSREVLRKALEMGFAQATILRGGLEAWKAKGYRVERYERSFHLDTPA